VEEAAGNGKWGYAVTEQAEQRILIFSPPLKKTLSEAIHALFPNVALLAI